MEHVEGKDFFIERLVAGVTPTLEEMREFVSTRSEFQHRLGPQLNRLSPDQVLELLDEREKEVLTLLYTREAMANGNDISLSVLFSVFMAAGADEWGIETTLDPLSDSNPKRALKPNDLFDKESVYAVGMKSGLMTPINAELDHVVSLLGILVRVFCADGHTDKGATKTRLGALHKGINIFDAHTCLRHDRIWCPCLSGKSHDLDAFNPILTSTKRYEGTYWEEYKNTSSMTITVRAQHWSLRPFIHGDNQADAEVRAESMIEQLCKTINDEFPGTTLTVHSVKRCIPNWIFDDEAIQKLFRDDGMGDFSVVYKLTGPNLPTHKGASNPVHLFPVEFDDDGPSHFEVGQDFDISCYHTATQCRLGVEKDQMVLIQMNAADTRENTFASRVFKQRNIVGDILAVSKGIENLSSRDTHLAIDSQVQSSNEGASASWTCRERGKRRHSPSML